MSNTKLPELLRRVAHELRTYNPAADEYKGQHIHGVWAREIDAAIALHDAALERQAGEAVAYINQHGVIHEAGYSWGAGNDLTPLFASLPAPQAVQAAPSPDGKAEPQSFRERWNIEQQEDGSLLVCFNLHDKGEKCEYRRYVPEGKAEQAEAPSDARWWSPPDSFANNWLTNGAALHPLTANLVVRFARALAAKLAAAEVKYGYSDGWRSADWMDECRAKLAEHVAKGDPRDVAAYCAFLWHHGESTATQPTASNTGERDELASRVRELERALQAAGDLAASSRSGPAKVESLQGIEEIATKALERRGDRFVPFVPKVVHDIVNEVCQAVAELPDRNSPENWPEAMLVTHDELQFIVTEALAALASKPPADNWQQYAKEGETAQACIERHRSEQDGLMSLLKQARNVPPAGEQKPVGYVVHDKTRDMAGERAFHGLRIDSAFQVEPYDPGCVTAVYAGPQPEQVAQDREDAERWRALESLPRAMVCRILERPELALRYKPAGPYTLTEEVDAIRAARARGEGERHD